MDITFVKDWKNPHNGKTISAGSVAGIHYKTAEHLLAEGIATIKGDEYVVLKKVIPDNVEELKPYVPEEEDDF